MDPAFLQHSRVVDKVMIICLWCSAGVMFLIIGCGVYQIIAGIYHMIVLAGEAGKGRLVSEILNGLELIFVSPLIYLLMLSLAKYINAVQPKPIEQLKNKHTYLNNAMLEITTVKILSVSLFISILILHAIDVVLADGMTTHLIIYIGVLLVTLIVYYCILDRCAAELKKLLVEGS